MEKKNYTISEIAELAGISPSTLRALERRFAIFSPHRTEGGHRLYTLDDLKVLCYIRKLQNKNNSLKNIAAKNYSTLLAEAVDYFGDGDEGSVKLTKDTEILQSAMSGNINLTLKLLEDLHKISADPPKFACLALNIINLIRNLSQDKKILSPLKKAILIKIRYYLLEAIFRKQSISDERCPLAVCSTIMSESDPLYVLFCAVHLWNLGYKIAFLGSENKIEDLYNLLLELKPKIICLGINDTINNDNLQEIAIVTSPIALNILIGNINIYEEKYQKFDKFLYFLNPYDISNNKDTDQYNKFYDIVKIAKTENKTGIQILSEIKKK